MFTLSIHILRQNLQLHERTLLVPLCLSYKRTTLRCNNCYVLLVGEHFNEGVCHMYVHVHIEAFYEERILDSTEILEYEMLLTIPQ